MVQNMFLRQVPSKSRKADPRSKTTKLHISQRYSWQSFRGAPEAGWKPSMFNADTKEELLFLQ